MPKITKIESLLFTREWIKKYEEEGLKIPRRIICHTYSLGEALALIYSERKILNSDSKESEKVLELK